MNVPENKDVFSLEAEVNTLKKTLLKERTEFERYISKVEKTKSTLNQELGKVKIRFEGKRKVKTTNSEDRQEREPKRRHKESTSRVTLQVDAAL